MWRQKGSRVAGGNHRQEPAQPSWYLEVGFHQRPSDALCRDMCRKMAIVWYLLFVQLRDSLGVQNG